MSVKRLAELTIRYNELQYTLAIVSAQRDTLARELLNLPAQANSYSQATTDILTDLIGSGFES